MLPIGDFSDNTRLESRTLYKCSLTNQFLPLDQLFFTDRLISADVAIQEITSAYCPVTFEQYSVKQAGLMKNQSPQSYLCPTCESVLVTSTSSEESEDISLACEGCGWTSLQLSPPLVTNDINVLLQTLASMRMHTPATITTTSEDTSTNLTDLSTAFNKLQDSLRQGAMQSTEHLLSRPLLPRLPLHPSPHLTYVQNNIAALSLYSMGSGLPSYPSVLDVTVPSAATSTVSVMDNTHSSASYALTPPLATLSNTNPYPSVLYTSCSPPYPLQKLPQPAALVPLISYHCPLTRTLLLKTSPNPDLPPTITRRAHLYVPTVSYQALALPDISTGDVHDEVLKQDPPELYHIITISSPLPYPIHVSITPIPLSEMLSSPELLTVGTASSVSTDKVNICTETIRDHILRMSITDTQKDHIFRIMGDRPCSRWKRSFVVSAMDQISQEVDLMHVSIQLRASIREDGFDIDTCVRTIDNEPIVREEFTRFVSLCNNIPVDHVEVKSALLDEGLLNSFILIKTGVVAVQRASTAVILESSLDLSAGIALRVTFAPHANEEMSFMYDVLLVNKEEF